MSVPGEAPPPTKRTSSRPELVLRLAAAAILAPVFLLGAWAGGVWFALIVAAAIALGGREWVLLCNIERPMMIALLAVLGPVLAIAHLSGGAGAGLLVLALALLSALGSAQGQRHRLWPAAGVVYLGIPSIAILWLRATPGYGLEALLFLVAMVWLTDIGAYAFGRAVGGPRLAPSISPGKTWAGAAGGLLLAVAGAYLGRGYMSSPPLPGALGLAIVLSIATQCGDLFESWVKRRFGKKDSGKMIPGHGGILDRVDGLLFAAPVMAAIIIVQRGAAPVWP